MSTYYYKGPLGSHSGSKLEILRLAELTPTEDTISKDGKTWGSLQDIFPTDYKDGKYWYYGGGSFTSFWVETEKYNRNKNNRFDYIGPRITSERLRIEEIIEEIALFPQEIHLVSTKDSPIWYKWNQVPDVYQKAIEQHPNINIEFEVDDRLRQHHLFGDRDWDDLILQLSGNTDFSDAPFTKRSIYSTDQTQEYNYQIPYTQMILQLICTTMVQELSNGESFHWPHIGRFTRKKYSNQKIYSEEKGQMILLPEHSRISFSSSSSLRKWLKNTERNVTQIPGDSAPVTSVKYWQHLDTTKLSRGRSFSRKISKLTDLPLEQVHGAISFINHLIYIFLSHNHSVFIPSIGTLYLSHRNKKMVLRFKAVRNKNDKFNIRRGTPS
jgi:nucleoid DNA-binding protein